MVFAKTLTCDAGARAIIERLRRAGHRAYLVGGCVRDQLMGRTPADWDVATDATPERIEALFERVVPVGKAFGVMIVVRPEGDYEVATFRGDGDYHDGRRPTTVTFTGPEEDVQRRDFTINALLYDPVAGEVLDYVGGVADIAAGLIRTVGEASLRFREDRLRLLRAVRFAARTGFRLEPSTAAAVRALAPLAATVSAERTGDELTRMLSEGAARRSFEMLEACGLLGVVLPEVAAMRGVPQPPEFHPEGDVWEHTLAMLELWDRRVQSWRQADAGADASGKPDAVDAGADEPGSPASAPPEAAGLTGSPEERAILGWAVLLHDVGKPGTLTDTDRIRFHGHDDLGASLAQEVLNRLRRPKRLVQAVQAVVAGHMRFIHIKGMREAKRRRFVQSPLFPLELELHRLDCVGSHGKLEGYDLAMELYRDELARPPVLEPLLRGDDLLACGFDPGPAIGRLLRAVEDARLEGRLNSREEALAWVARQRHGGPDAASAGKGDLEG